MACDCPKFPEMVLLTGEQMFKNPSLWGSFLTQTTTTGFHLDIIPMQTCLSSGFIPLWSLTLFGPLEVLRLSSEM